ncbi:MAG TPA: proton-conducting transporter membrane subunit, partial [Planctomycetota bacterium]|nr:proton-conducting transporter membrane subunit [Planctomycetota bacterium]
SQTALIAFGLENVSVVGRAGAILAWHVMALATSGFLMTLAAIEARRGALSLVAASGCFARTPRMATAFLLLGLASVSLPLTLGFAAEDLLVQGTVQSYPVLGLAVIVATALNGIQVLRCFFALFTGTHVHSGEMDLNRREFAAMTVVLGILLFGGMAPRLFVPTPAVQNVPALRSH